MFKRILFVFLSMFIILVNSVTAVKTQPICNINRFSKVDDNYYRGGQPKDEDFECLANLRIKTVINLRLQNFKKHDKEKEIVNELGMKYINIPMSPFFPPTNEQIDLFFSILNNPQNLPVFVHCQHGEDRTGIMTALYRVQYYNWTYDQAYAEMKANGYHSILFPEQKHFLRKYVNSLNTDKTVK